MIFEDLEKNCFNLTKITVADQIKIIDRNIMRSEAQYNLDGKAAKISALSSNNLHKYEYLASDDLDLKLSTVEQARFKYSKMFMVLKVLRNLKS